MLGGLGRRVKGKDLWKKLKVAVKTSQLEENQLRKYQSIQTQALQEAQKQLLQDGQGLTDDDLANAKPRNDDGSGTLYSRESLVLRYGLRRHPGIVNAVQSLWDFEGPRDDLGCLTKAGYVSFYLRVAKYLDASFKLASATATVEAEWEVDRKGCDALSFVLFFDSLFQLADLWVDSLDPAEYVAFLDGITASIFVVDEQGRRQLKDSKDIDCIQQQGDPSDDDDDDDEEHEEEKPVPRKGSSTTKPNKTTRPTRADVELVPTKQDRIPPTSSTPSTDSKTPPINAAPKATDSSGLTTPSKRSSAGGGASSTPSKQHTAAKRNSPERTRASRAKPNKTAASHAPLALVLQPEQTVTSNASVPSMLSAPDPPPQDKGQESPSNNAVMGGVVAPDLSLPDSPATNTHHPNQTNEPQRAAADEGQLPDDTDDDPSADKHAISVRLVRFASARNMVKKHPGDGRDQHVPTRHALNVRGHQKLAQLIPSTENKMIDGMRVGRNSFIQSAMPHASAAVIESHDPHRGGRADDITRGVILVDEANEANTIRVQIQPSCRAKADTSQLVLPQDDHSPNKMRGGALVKTKLSPTVDESCGDFVKSTPSTSPPKTEHASAIVIGVSLIKPPSHLSPLRGTGVVSPVIQKGSHPGRFVGHSHPHQLQRANDDIAADNDCGGEISLIPTLLSASLTHSLPIFRGSPSSPRFIPSGLHASTQSLPHLDHPNAAAALLTINRREFHLERGQYCEKHVPNRIAMLKRRQKVHQTQNFAARLLDNSILWDD